MDNKPYYYAYENRYQKVFEAGVEHWGHTPDDEILFAALKKWVENNDLVGKKVIEFACGEGAAGVILSKLGCRYHGVDIAPSAVGKTQKAIENFSEATAEVIDMVKETTGELYDAALDCMGFHMLVTDEDRKSYLRNAIASLKSKSPMLFFRESYRNGKSPEGVYKGIVESFEQWKEITGGDYDTPSLRHTVGKNKDTEILIPLVPARANDRDGYTAEMQSAGFIVEEFVEMDVNEHCPYSASIFVRKP